MQLYCQGCRTWIKVRVRPGEPEAHAGARTRREHSCMAPVKEAFDAIVGQEDWAFLDLGTTGTTPPRSTRR